MSLYDSKIDKLTSAELARLITVLEARQALDAQLEVAGDPGDAALVEKLHAEHARVTVIEDAQADYRKTQEVYAANAKYVREAMKPGDVIEYTTHNWNHGGTAIVRRMRVISFKVVELDRGVKVDLRGVIITKAGAVHGSLNGRTGSRYEMDVSIGNIRLVEAA